MLTPVNLTIVFFVLCQQQQQQEEESWRLKQKVNKSLVISVWTINVLMNNHVISGDEMWPSVHKITPGKEPEKKNYGTNEIK